MTAFRPVATANSVISSTASAKSAPLPLPAASSVRQMYTGDCQFIPATPLPLSPTAAAMPAT